jgi:glutaryl-CoA dehydrogenase
LQFSEKIADISEFIDQRRSGDFYRTADVLSPDDRNVLTNVRSFAEERVAPIINDYWGRAEFPFELIPTMPHSGSQARATAAMAAPERTCCSMGLL